jgi:hypothetical protein
VWLILFLPVIALLSATQHLQKLVIALVTVGLLPSWRSFYVARSKFLLGFALFNFQGTRLLNLKG